MTLDDRLLGTLLEESDDVHADAMRQTRATLHDVVERGLERRARAVTGAAAGLGLVALGATAAGAGAETPADVAAAQTAAAIENLAIRAYASVSKLALMKRIPDPAAATIFTFVTNTVKQHSEHATAFNAAAVRLGGKPQAGPDLALYNSVVIPAFSKLKTPKNVIDFIATVELIAAETYASQTAAVSDANLRSTFASIAGVENQHRAVLLTVSALLGANAPQLVVVGGVAGELPPEAGQVGFPTAFLPLDQARPATEGAVQ